MNTDLPTAKLIREIFYYDPCSGQLLRRGKNRRSSSNGAKRDLRYKNYKLRYKQVYIYGRSCLAHRIIWVWVYGYWPNEIDHIDGNGLNNKLANLRNVDRSHNRRNSPLNRNNRSGHSGVRRRRNKWRAEIKIYGRRKHLGYFDCIEDAIAERKKAEKKYRFHENHGRASD